MDGKQTIPSCSTVKFQNTREKKISKAFREGKKRKANHTKKDKESELTSRVILETR